MNKKGFLIGLFSGIGVFVMVIIGVFAYVSIKIVPELEKLEDELDPPKEIATKIEEEIELIRVLDKSKHSISFNSPKPIVINLWATWCKPCITEMTSFEDLYGKIGNEADFFFLSNEDLAKQSKMIQEKNWNLPFFMYSDSLPESISSSQLPTTVVIKNGMIYYKHLGKANWDSQNTIDFILGLR